MAKKSGSQGTSFERAWAKVEDEVDHRGPLALREDEPWQETYTRYERAVEVATEEFLRNTLAYVRRLGIDPAAVHVARRAIPDGPHARRTEVTVKVKALEPGGKRARKFEFVTHF